jgi:hypothetical protein
MGLKTNRLFQKLDGAYNCRFDCFTFADINETEKLENGEHNQCNCSKHRNENGPAEEKGNHRQKCFEDSEFDCLPDMEFCVFRFLGSEECNDDSDKVKEVTEHAKQLGLGNIFRHVVAGVIVRIDLRYWWYVNRGSVYGLLGWIGLRKAVKCVDCGSANGTESGPFRNLVTTIGTLIHGTSSFV